MPSLRPRTQFALTCLSGMVLALLLALSASAAGHRVGRAVFLNHTELEAPIGIKARLSDRSDADLNRVVTKLHSAGVSIVREDVPWSTIEPQPGTYYWGQTDRWIEATTRQGIQVMAVLASPPTWVTGRWNIPPLGPRQVGDFSNFVRDVVARYGSGGSFWLEHPNLAPLPIQYWDIWNEPYESRFWSSETPDPEGYARLFKSGVKTARRADPTARFLLEADTRIASDGWPWKPFLAVMFDAVPDLGRYAYAVSVHPYQGDGHSPRPCSPSTRYAGVNARWQATAMQFCRIADVRRILDSHDAGATKIWITEIGWSTAPDSDRAVSDAAQASYVRQVFNLLRTRYRGLVSGLIWYEYQGPESNPSELGDYLGLVRTDGTPKPAWQTFSEEALSGL